MTSESGFVAIIIPLLPFGQHKATCLYPFNQIQNSFPAVLNTPKTQVQHDVFNQFLPKLLFRSFIKADQQLYLFAFQDPPNQIKTLHREKTRGDLGQPLGMVKMRPNEIKSAFVPVIGIHKVLRLVVISHLGKIRTYS